MQATIFAGTDDGLHLLGARTGHELGGHALGGVVAGGTSLWALVEGAWVFTSADGTGWRQVTEMPEGRATCLLPTPDGLLAGSPGAHLFRYVDGNWERVEAFEGVEGRDTWHTPWGGPPDTRSLSVDEVGTVYANVHVGGIPTSHDGGRTWRPTIEVDADVHQVLAPVSRPGWVLAATARGLAVSEDGGTTWRFERDGLAAPYSRSVAVSESMILVGASDGPSGRRAAVYRRPIAGDGGFERCGGGLPEWFTGNIDTYCLDAAKGTVAFGTDGGSVFVSADEGETWEEAARGLAPVRCMLVR
jgi:hypothetical protein